MQQHSMQQHYIQQQRLLWPQGANMVLGAWLISGPATLGYRSTALMWSDISCGVLLIVLTTLALSARRDWLAWPMAAIGLWLMGAPLMFWAPTAAAYHSETLIGALVVTFAVLVPGTPQDRLDFGPETPPGWSYNPSAWAQRTPIVALALVGFFISRYMAAFQLGHIDTVWEPFFSPGTRKILESDVSKAFPVSDAGLGALSYVVDALAGMIGGTRRWRTMPWMVVLFGLFIIPPGVVSIVLVILQPVAVGTWCTLCLLAAVAMLLMVPPALDEVIATGQLLLRNWRDGKGFWRTFWNGEVHDTMAKQVITKQVITGQVIEEQIIEVHPATSLSAAATLSVGPLLSAASPAISMQDIFSGLAIFATPWNLLLSTLSGIWLMAAPTVLGVSGALATSHYVVGALAVTFAVIAGTEVARMVRLLNLFCGAWQMVAPWVLGGGTPVATWASALGGAALIALSLPRSRLTEPYGGWERFIV